MMNPQEVTDIAYGRELSVALRSMAAILVVPLAAIAAALTLTGAAPSGPPLHQCVAHTDAHPSATR